MFFTMTENFEEYQSLGKAMKFPLKKETTKAS